MFGLSPTELFRVFVNICMIGQCSKVVKYYCTRMDTFKDFPCNALVGGCYVPDLRNQTKLLPGSTAARVLPSAVFSICLEPPVYMLCSTALRAKYK